jgi:hypothetical protein
VRIGFLCLYGMGGRRDCGCIGLTVYCGDLPGATAYAAEAPITSTQGGVGKLTTAASASAISSSDRGNRTSSIEHPYDRSRPWWKPASNDLLGKFRTSRSRDHDIRCAL